MRPLAFGGGRGGSGRCRWLGRRCVGGGFGIARSLRYERAVRLLTRQARDFPKLPANRGVRPSVL